MKILVTIAVMILSAGIYGQEPKPDFKKEGGIVKATFYHGNGTVAQEGYFKNGKLHGEWIMYDPEGIKIATGEYIEGKKQGNWFFWKNTGEALREVAYLDGKPVHVVIWNKEKSLL